MVYAKKSLGQNFLKDGEILSKIVAAGEVAAGEHVVEIGAGRGALTRELAATGAMLTALEYDGELVPLLRNEFGKKGNVTIVHTDVRMFLPPEAPYKLIANIPYYLTSPILRQFFMETPHVPELAVLLVQKEVAEKIADEKRRSILQLEVTPFATTEYVLTVPASCFSPMPKVQSAVVRLRRREVPLIAAEEAQEFSRFVHHLFRFPRKMLKAALPEAELAAAGIDVTLRPEGLPLEDIVRLFAARKKKA